MKLLRTGVVFGIILSLIISVVPFAVSGQMGKTDRDGQQDFASDRILVKFKAGTDEAAKREIHGRHGGSVIEEVMPLDIHVIKVPAGKVRERMNSFRSEKAVEFVEPDYVAKAIGTPNDPYFSNQWGMTRIQAPQAWDVTQGNANTRVAIMDTGVDQNHEDLTAQVNVNFSSSRTVDDLNGHGTHVAGIIAAATGNGTGIAGVGYSATIMNVKVLDDTGSGYYSSIINGITWAADNGAQVINMSLGGSAASAALENAVNYAWSKGVVLVAAAGNSGVSTLVYPACYNNCIAVAGTDQNDAKAGWSNYGSWVDVAAPGVYILSTLPNHPFSLQNYGYSNYGYMSGTSMASPYVAGLATLVWSTGYGTSNTSVRSRIESTADQIGGTGSYWQYGRINAYKAVAPAAPQPPVLSVAVSAPGLTGQKIFSVQAGVANSGGQPASGVTAIINLPSGLNTTSPTQLLGDIAAKASVTASWEVTAIADGQYTVTVTATANGASPANGTAAVKVDTTPPTPSNVSVSNITSTSADITWTTSELSDSGVDYGISTGYLGYIYNPQLVTSHKITLANLTPSTMYNYQVTSTDAAGNKAYSSGQSFNTSQVSSPEFSISASPSLRTVRAGRSTTFTVTMTALNGYGSTVNLSVSGGPGNAVYNFSPKTVSPSSRTSYLKITTSGSTPRGVYTLMITGTDSGGVSRKAQVRLSVR